MQLTNGTELKRGDYRILGILGQGGFGITYLALQVKLNRKVAIKEFFMKDLCNRDDDGSHVSVGSVGSKDLVERFKQKFLKEARSIASLEHKHIVPVIDVFEENGTAYYVMKHFGGGSLSACTALSEEKALRYIRQIASAIGFIHGRHMMHLDIKPGNILLDSEDNAIVIDFGLAKQYDEAGHQTSTTPVGISHGYAPIEQYEAGALKTFTPVTDIYALGATLFFLLTGARPPKASYINDEGLPPMPEALSLTVRKAVESAMQPRRKDRPQSVEEFIELVESGKCKDESEEVVTVIDDVADVYGPPPVIIDKEEKDEYDVTIIDPVSCVYGPPPFVIDKEEPEEINTSGNENKKAGKRKIVPIAAIILLLACCVAGYFMLFSGENEKAKKTNIKEYPEEISENAQPLTGTINGHEYVDMGLPSGTLWATCNIGANKPEDYGHYFTWGNIKEKNEYIGEQSVNIEKQIFNISANIKYDAASVKWGSSWRIPTLNNFAELLNTKNCIWEYVNNDSICGYKVTSRKNNNTLFFPSAGCYAGYNKEHSMGFNINAWYWCAERGLKYSNYAKVLYFTEDEYTISTDLLHYFHSIRPVSNSLTKKSASLLSKKRQSKHNRTQTYRVNGVEFKMIAVNGGIFNITANENLTHQIIIDDYHIGETEVTQALWQAVMGSNPSYSTGTNKPVETVSYNDCITFINKLNTLLKGQLPQGRKFRLPTEDEWKFAARGGNKSKGYKYSGSNNLNDVAWYNDNSSNMSHPVKQKNGNELGIYDMNGNVGEWCSDCYGCYLSNEKPSRKITIHGIHGSDWQNDEISCLETYYNSAGDSYKSSECGLRLAL